MALRTFLRPLVAVLFASVLSACALTEAEVDLVYTPGGTAIAMPTADGVVVEVRALDARPINRDKVSVKKNGYGMEMAAIRANQDVPTLVRSAVERELVARGFGIGEGDVVALVEIGRFYADYKTGFWTADNVADIQLNVQVRDTDGRMYYGKGITGMGKVEGVVIMDGGPVKQSLEAGLTDAVGTLMRDEFFLQSLIEAQEIRRRATPESAQPRAGHVSASPMS